MKIAWETNAGVREAAAKFFVANIKADPAYISHGEVQCGLSVDGVTWADDLETRFVADLADIDADQHLAVMRDDQGAMIAVALVQWVDTPRVKFGVIEDLAVPAQKRSSGLGQKMMLWIEDEAAKRQCRWLFLESGKNNLRAHSFFERHGFREMSHVFIKPVGGK
ncbi:MAG TPA: GNAT family N-acetyltransferase [Hyphomonadaceae bacterium]|nr:GNAT family N-acetyltransferase [Hyphomonadaceae bacterium]HPN07139.1 GNAT family N-acetyltransferase [Hyphomonadaceae bacterium]